MIWGLPRVVLDHELLVEVERHLVATGLVEDGAGQLRGIDAQPLRRLVGTERLLGDLERLALAMRLADLDPVAGLSWYDGMLVGRPLTAKWPWVDELAGGGARLVAKPIRKTALSSRSSSIRSRFSPVTPGRASAASK